MDPTASTRIQLCGRLVVVWDGERIEAQLPSRQGRLLFAYLVVHRRRPVARSLLIEALWAQGAPGEADAAMRVLLSKLRRVLGPEALAPSEAPHLVLPAGAFVDLEAATENLHEAESAAAQEQWDRAWAPSRAALHTAERGFLPGQEAAWIEDVRRSLEDVRLRALECIALAGLGLGGPETASAERAGRALIDSSPFRESGYLHLMRALSAQGNVAEAIRIYDDLRCLLRDELGIAPGAALQDLNQRLISGATPASP